MSIQRLELQKAFSSPIVYTLLLLLPVCYAFLLAVGTALVAWRWKREKDIDLVI